MIQDTRNELGRIQCTHYWKIDEYDVGHCIKCGAERDFGALLKKLQRKLDVGSLSQRREPAGVRPKFVFGRGH